MHAPRAPAQPASVPRALTARPPPSLAPSPRAPLPSLAHAPRRRDAV